VGSLAAQLAVEAGADVIAVGGPDAQGTPTTLVKN
jgi:hypothetical protein